MGRRVHIIRRSRGSFADGRVNWDLPGIAVEAPDLAELRADLIAHIERKMRQRFRASPAVWRAFGRWMDKHLKVTGNSITWPIGAALSRMGGVAIIWRWFDDVVRVHVRSTAFPDSPRWTRRDAPFSASDDS